MLERLKNCTVHINVRLQRPEPLNDPQTFPSAEMYLYPILLHVHVNSVNHTAGPMSRMSNKRDFHIIMVKMLNDLSAEDNVRRSLNAGF